MLIIDRMKQAEEARMSASAEWQAVDPLDRQVALETLTGVLSSKLWLQERREYFETLTDEQLIRWRKKTFPNSIQ